MGHWITLAAFFLPSPNAQEWWAWAQCGMVRQIWQKAWFFMANLSWFPGCLFPFDFTEKVILFLNTWKFGTRTTKWTVFDQRGWVKLACAILSLYVWQGLLLKILTGHGMDFPPAARQRPRFKEKKIKMDTLSQFYFAKKCFQGSFFTLPHTKKYKKPPNLTQEYIFIAGPLRPELLGLAPHPASPPAAWLQCPGPAAFARSEGSTQKHRECEERIIVIVYPELEGSHWGLSSPTPGCTQDHHDWERCPDASWTPATLVQWPLPWEACSVLHHPLVKSLSLSNLKEGITTEASCRWRSGSEKKGWLSLWEIPGHIPATEVQRKWHYLWKLWKYSLEVTKNCYSNSRAFPPLIGMQNRFHLSWFFHHFYLLAEEHPPWNNIQHIHNQRRVETLGFIS